MTAPGRQGAPATKTARQARIVAILSREQVHSQEQLSGLLVQYAGLPVTQATLSRDLDELGVVRLRGGLALLQNLEKFLVEFRRAIWSWDVEFTHNCDYRPGGSAVAQGSGQVCIYYLRGPVHSPLLPQLCGYGK